MVGFGVCQDEFPTKMLFSPPNVSFCLNFEEVSSLPFFLKRVASFFFFFFCPQERISISFLFLV